MKTTQLSQSSVEDIHVYFSLSLSSDHRLCLEKKMDGTQYSILLEAKSGIVPGIC